MIVKSSIQVLKVDSSVSDSDIDKTFKSMHQSIMTKIKGCAYKDWIVLDAIIKHSIKNFEC